MSSLSTLPLTRRVEPNATSVLVVSCSSVGRAPEQLVVLRVGARPTGLDVVDAEVVELLGDPQLVLDGERDALELRPVPQRRVVDLDLPGELARRNSLAERSHDVDASSSSADMLTPVLVLVDLAADGLGVLLGDGLRSSGPGTGCARSSTEFTALTSAAVPHTNISSAM